MSALQHDAKLQVRPRSFLLRDGAARDDAAAQPLDSATVRRWLRDRVQVNPSSVLGRVTVLLMAWRGITALHVIVDSWNACNVYVLQLHSHAMLSCLSTPR